MAENDLTLAGCRVLQTALVDLDHDRQGDCVRWTRCGPDEPSSLADGGTDYPRDAIIAVSAGGAKSWTLYTNEQAATAERFEEFAVLRLGVADERLLARAVGYGTGNVQNWAIIDIAGGVPRRWTEPPLNDALASVITSHERLGKQFGRGLELEGGELEVSWLVYRTGDPNCCPSGGLAKARLVPTPNGLEMARIWREPQP
jgi:hypothetical protein